MKILFLSNNPISEPLQKWLREENEVLLVDKKITAEVVKALQPDWILSYNYRFLITPDVIALLPHNILNLHISYLPWNRGVHPNLWSFIEETPKGVTIHQIDAGLDTGPIIAQKQIEIDPNVESVRSSYERLHREIQELFKTEWKGEMRAVTQKGKGSSHTLKESKILDEILSDVGYDISVATFLDHYKRRAK